MRYSINKPNNYTMNTAGVVVLTNMGNLVM